MQQLKTYLLCPYWGSEHLDLEAFLYKAKGEGYDGVDMWVPESKQQRIRLLNLLEQYNLKIVSHQHQADGKDIHEFCRSFHYYLNVAAEVNPIIINSHSGRDYFCLEDQLRILDTAAAFEVQNDYKVAHETHRGRMLFCPAAAQTLFDLRPELKITADFSHWVCVTESYLENFESIMTEAIKRTIHVHARVGFPEGPQVPDPRQIQYREALACFTRLWSRILETRAQNDSVITFTPECGPPPYMWTHLDNNLPVASQWEVNLYIRQLIKDLQK